MGQSLVTNTGGTPAGVCGRSDTPRVFSLTPVFDALAFGDPADHCQERGIRVRQGTREREWLMKLFTHCTAAVMLVVTSGFAVHAQLADDLTIDSKTVRTDVAERSANHARVQQIHSNQQINAQILCLKKARTGTRIVTRRCQSIADWKTEIAREYFKRYMLEM